MTLLEVYAKEFKAFSKSYYEEAIGKGRITVNDKKSSVDYKVKSIDKISHKVTRNESPVLDLPIKVILDNDDLLVVDKPSSIPVHPCGNFKYNSLSMLLELEHNYKNIKPVHRLDR